MVAAFKSSQDRFAGPPDYEACRLIHRRYGSTYYFATSRFQPEVRRRVHAVYGFVRLPDEWVDNPGSMTLAEQRKRLLDYRRDLLLGLEGVRPSDPVLRAFCDVCKDASVPPEEPLLFLDAMEMDLDTSRYETYGELRKYMRGSACAVGLMMCRVLNVPPSPEVERAAMALGEAMQLTNFLRDVGDDLQRERVYIPLEDLSSFGVRTEEMKAGEVTERWKRLMQFEIARARALYKEADKGLPHLPPHERKAVQIARVLYARILNRIEARGYDVFSGRARTSRVEKLSCAAKVLLGRPVA